MNLGPYRVGDQPATPLQVDILTDEDLSAYTSATITIWDSALINVGTVTVPVEDDLLEFTVPDGALASAGLHQVSIVLKGPGGARLTLDSLPMVVEPVTSEWHTIATAKALWFGNAPDDAHLFTLLEMARFQVEAYAPALEAGSRVPAHYRDGQLMQARNLNNAQNASPSGDGSDASFILSPVPLDWQVKQALRPRKGVPSVG